MKWTKFRDKEIWNPLAVWDWCFREKRVAASLDYWASIKDSQKGKRGFVIGNGPSLRISDLDRLKDEVTIASNKIYLAFGETSWRPSYFTVCDRLVWKKIRGEVGNYVEPIHVPDFLFGIPVRLRKKTQVWKLLPKGSSKSVDFSGDFEDGAYGGATVTFDNLQLAVHLGLNPIYIIGCDHYYAGEVESDQDIPIEQGSESTHFIKGYRKPGEKVNPAPIKKMNDAYRRARLYADSHGIGMFNATRGGFLEEFERVEYDRLF